jgi:hypothetical protein
MLALNILVFAVGYFKGIRFSMSRKEINNHVLDPLLWTFILDDKKASKVLGIQRWLCWVHDELKLNQFYLIYVRPINLVHVLQLGNKRNGVFLQKEGGETAEYFKN